MASSSAVASLARRLLEASASSPEQANSSRRASTHATAPWASSPQASTARSSPTTSRYSTSIPTTFCPSSSVGWSRRKALSSCVCGQAKERRTAFASRKNGFLPSKSPCHPSPSSAASWRASRNLPPKSTWPRLLDSSLVLKLRRSLKKFSQVSWSLTKTLGYEQRSPVLSKAWMRAGARNVQNSLQQMVAGECLKPLLFNGVNSGHRKIRHSLKRCNLSQASQ